MYNNHKYIYKYVLHITILCNSNMGIGQPLRKLGANYLIIFKLLKYKIKLNRYFMIFLNNLISFNFYQK